MMQRRASSVATSSLGHQQHHHSGLVLQFVARRSAPMAPLSISRRPFGSSPLSTLRPRCRSSFSTSPLFSGFRSSSSTSSCPRSFHSLSSAAIRLQHNQWLHYLRSRFVSSGAKGREGLLSSATKTTRPIPTLSQRLKMPLFMASFLPCQQSFWQTVKADSVETLPPDLSLFFNIQAQEEDATLALVHPECIVQEEKTRSFFSALLESFFLVLRTVELCIRFMPLMITYPFCVKLFPSYGTDLWYRFLGWTLSRSGPCLIKLGQWLSTRRDILPDHLCNHLSHLRDDAPAHSFNHTIRQIRKAYGMEISDIFESFSTKPIASGAIAQVYEAVLKEPYKYGNSSFQRVAVKVTHPNVKAHIIRDLKILSFVVAMTERLISLQWLQLQDNLENFSSRMEAQCDLRVEAQNLVTFTKNFKDAPNVRFPKPVLQYCHPLILVESFEEGRHISNYTGDDVPVEVRRTIARVSMDAFLKMMLVDNFIHADLHPGNILVDDGRKHNRDPQLVFLDAGLTTTLLPHDRRNLIALFNAVSQGESNKAAKLIAQGQEQLTSVSVENFAKEMSTIIDEVSHRGLAEVQMSRVFYSVLALARKHKVIIEANFTTLVRNSPHTLPSVFPFTQTYLNATPMPITLQVVGTVVIEGIGRQLDPDLNMVKRATPMLVRNKEVRDAYIRKRLNQSLDWFRHHAPVRQT
ncbi:hypothetical protein QOT17_010111 [Balamuthia mandrillaris]